MKKICILALSYGRIAKIVATFSNGLVNSAMGQTPCSTERISCSEKQTETIHCSLSDITNRTKLNNLPTRLATRKLAVVSVMTAMYAKPAAK